MRRTGRAAGPAFWIELVGATLSAALALVTLLWRDWIEELFGIDPDAGSGAVEWGVLLSAVALTILLGDLARRGWRRAALAIA